MAKIVEMINPLTGLPEQVDKLDHTAQEIDDAVDLAPQLSNPNLLDNWYFRNPINQRHGRVVKPNTTYYSDNTLATAAGTTSAYVTAYRYATGTASGVNYAAFKLEDTDTAPTYYAAPENVVRGYTASTDTYSVDRWLVYGNSVLLVGETGLKIKQTGIIQKFSAEFIKSIVRKTVTLSCIYGNSLFAYTFTVPEPTGSTVVLQDGNGVVRLRFRTVTLKNTRIDIVNDSTNEIELKAVKLELGSQQTLAHQDENGNWVLNEIPDYGEQLARCQRYFQLYSSADIRPAKAVDCRPVMRDDPSQGTIVIGSTTYYYNTAEL